MVLGGTAQGRCAEAERLHLWAVILAAASPVAGLVILAMTALGS